MANDKCFMKCWKLKLLIIDVRALSEITVVHYILIFSGLRTSIREIYNNEGIAGFFR